MQRGKTVRYIGGVCCVSVRCGVLTMTALSVMSFLMSSAGDDMLLDEAEAGGVDRVGGCESGLSEKVDVAEEAEEAGERTKRRTRASPANAANEISSERVVSFIQKRFEMCVSCYAVFSSISISGLHSSAVDEDGQQ